MENRGKIVILGVLAGAVFAVVALKHDKPASASRKPAAATQDASVKLPRLLDLGATQCVPCKMMAPVLEELKKEYAGRMKVEFIDVSQNEEAGRIYGVEIIPTQIFMDANGKEMFRHTGFIGKNDILAKWKELGVDL